MAQNLFDLDMNINDLLNRLVDEETGEIDPEVERQLTELEGERDDRIDAWCFWLDADDAEIVGMEQMIAKLDDKLAKKKEAHKRSKERLEAYLGGEKFKSATHSVFYRRNQYVHLTQRAEDEPEKYLPAKYVRAVTTVKPDKKAIMDALKAGAMIPDAYIDSKTSMIIK